MLQKNFRKYITDHQLFQKEDALLVAASGGADSMVLCRLLKLEDYSFSVAHCNFELRGEDSELDEAFVERTLTEAGVKVFIKRFNTAEYADINKLGIQEAARNLRYEWFEELRSTRGFKYILTAHHGSDSVETALFNFIKGTGIQGLHGILPQNGHIVRPLLFALKGEIEEFVRINQIGFREDASNFQDKYARNYIRLHIIPHTKLINPLFEQTALENIERLKAAEAVYRWGIEKIKLDAVFEQGSAIKISREVILNSPAAVSVLYEIIKDYDFNAAQARQILENNASGRLFYSAKYRLLADRSHFIIEPADKDPVVTGEYTIDLYNGSWEAGDACFEWNTSSIFEKDIGKNALIAMFDLDKLNFPLRLRRWKEGDSFQPLGLKGKTQKLSDFFNNAKLSIFEKERVWILENGSRDICWIAGWRIDDRFKAGKGTASILTFSVEYKNALQNVKS